jgi:hypothetical protein
VISDIRMEDEYSLSPQSLDQFRREGWAPLPGLISRELAGEIMHRLYASDNTVAPTATEKWMTATDYQRVLRMHDGMAWKDDWFMQLALSRRMSQLALQLIGEDEGLSSSICGSDTTAPSQTARLSLNCMGQPPSKQRRPILCRRRGCL